GRPTPLAEDGEWSLRRSPAECLAAPPPPADDPGLQRSLVGVVRLARLAGRVPGRGTARLRIEPGRLGRRRRQMGGADGWRGYRRRLAGWLVVGSLGSGAVG